MLFPFPPFQNKEFYKVSWEKYILMTIILDKKTSVRHVNSFSATELHLYLGMCEKRQNKVTNLSL